MECLKILRKSLNTNLPVFHLPLLTEIVYQDRQLNQHFQMPCRILPIVVQVMTRSKKLTAYWMMALSCIRFHEIDVKHSNLLAKHKLTINGRYGPTAVVVFGSYQNQPSTKDVANRLSSRMLKNAPAIDFVEDMPFV